MPLARLRPLLATVACVVVSVAQLAPSVAQDDRRDALVQGRVVTPDGRPLPGGAITITESPPAWDRVAGLLTFALSGGATCLSGSCVPGSASAATTTDGEGRYVGSLPRAHLPGAQLDTDWFVTVSVPSTPPFVGNAMVSEEFEVAAATEISPDLVLWSPELTVRTDALGVAFSWPPLPTARFDNRSVRYVLAVVDENGRSVWSVDAADPGVRLDARVLEDAEGSVALIARGDITAGPTIFHQTMTAPRPPFASGGVAATSRGSRCSVVATDDTKVDVAQGCWLTDGDFASTRPGPPSCSRIQIPAELKAIRDRSGGIDCQPAVASTIVDLASPKETGFVVVRGKCACRVELSADAAEWEAVGSMTGVIDRPLLIDPSSDLVRYVRVSSTGSDGGVEAITEVSVFAPRDGERIPDERGILHPGAAGTARSARNAGAVAALLAIGVAVATVVRLRRRPAPLGRVGL